MLKEGIVDPEKTIYISFSDNYSDIPASWDNFQDLESYQQHS